MTQTSILPPNSTPMERALEATFAARLDALPLPVGQMMNPATCPAAFLPWLAWALSVDEWSPEWTEEAQRAAIAASIGVHRRKGTVAALRAAIAAAGYGEVEVVERFALQRRDGTRRYNGGNNNYAKGASDPQSVFWTSGQTQNGIIAVLIESGINPITNEAYFIYALSGILTAGAAIFGYDSIAGSQLDARSGQTYTASARLTVSGPGTGNGARVMLRDAVVRMGNTVTSGPEISAATYTLTADGTNRCAILIMGNVGTVIDCTVRVEGLQFELSDQRNVLTNLPLIHGSPDHWAEYRLIIARPVTIAQAQQIRRIAAGVAPARCHLKLLTYPAAQHLRNGTIAYDGNFTHGAA